MFFFRSYDITHRQLALPPALARMLIHASHDHQSRLPRRASPAVPLHADERQE